MNSGSGEKKLTLNEVTILKCLSRQSRCGTEIIKIIQEVFEAKTACSVVYPALKLLEAKAYIVLLPRDRLRSSKKHYQIATAGQEILSKWEASFGLLSTLEVNQEG